MDRAPWYLSNCLSHFDENKDHLIDRLNLTDEQKETLKAFFKKYPSHESKIDWNKKNLVWEDFTDLLANEGKSKTQAKKYGLSGLKLDEDYKIVLQNDSFTIYYPLTFLASETLANPKVAPLGVTGKWCIAGGNYDEGVHDKYWASYLNKRIDFFFIFTKNSKYAVARYPELIADSEIKFECFDSEDNLIDLYDIPGFNFGTEIKLIEYPREAMGTEYSKKNGFIIRTIPNLGAILVDYDRGATDIVTPEEVTIISESAFAGNSRIKNVVISKNVVEIESGAFRHCENLEEVTFEEPSKIKGIPACCFANCHNLKKVNLPKDLVGIYFKAFESCYELRTLQLPETAYAIDDRAFENSGIENIKLPLKTRCISARCFNNCPNLKTFKIPDNTEVIYTQAFLKCFNLETIILPKSLRKIYPLVFEGCSKLAEIIYPGTLKELFNNVDGCSELIISNTTIKCSDKKLLVDKNRDFVIENC